MHMNKSISITFMSGPDDGKVLSFEQPEVGEERVLLIGRREGCDIHLPSDNQASRLHARLLYAAIPVTASDSVADPFILSFWLEDRDSRNGTFLENNQNQITGKVSLRPGTLFRVGRTWLRLDVPLPLDDLPF
ncbi:MAG: FHA domain-containing protein [Anaerolineaceae bacterium]|nr:FHA domain-containing protein [Anaerolineaceae bacterium]